MNIPDGQINYRLLGHISAGAHGHVIRAVHCDNNENDIQSLLAIKRIFVRQNTNSLLCVLREIKCLQLLQPHHNVIFGKESIYFYFLNLSQFMLSS